MARALEGATLAWNVAGVFVLVIAALKAHSAALGGFGIDSAIEIIASAVVLYELGGVDVARQRRKLRLIAWAFAGLAGYLAIQSIFILITNMRPHHSAFGILWTGLTAIVMLALATGKFRIGTAMESQLLLTESRVTLVDGVLAIIILVGLVLNAVVGWWWADPAAAMLIVAYAARESIGAFRLSRDVPDDQVGACGQSCASCTNLCETPAV